MRTPSNVHTSSAGRRLVAWVLLAGIGGMVRADPVFDLAQRYFTAADTVGDFAGEPLAAPVYQGEHLLG